GIRNRTLEELFRSSSERRIGGQESIKGLQRPEETINLLRPGKRLGVLPRLLPFSNGERPIKQVAHGGQNVRRRAAFFAGTECGKAFRCAAQGLARAIGQRGQRMPQKLAAGLGSRLDRLSCVSHVGSLPKIIRARQADVTSVAKVNRSLTLNAGLKPCSTPSS